MLSAIYEWGNRATWIAAAVIAILFFYAVIYAFPNARLAALQQAPDVAENWAFCETHGMPFGTREHTLCAEGLMDITANERQRTLDELGFLGVVAHNAELPTQKRNNAEQRRRLPCADETC